MGARTTSSVANRYVGVQVQGSVKAAVIPKGWGTFRCACNLLDYLDFASKSQSQGGGKGGGGGAKSYTYSASVVLGVCAGPVAGVRTVWRDQSTYTDGATSALAQAGLSLAAGAVGQPPWSYLEGAHADHALGYSGLAYVCATGYALNSSATVPNHGFEVQSVVRQAANGEILDDANPARHRHRPADHRAAVAGRRPGGPRRLRASTASPPACCCRRSWMRSAAARTCSPTS